MAAKRLLFCLNPHEPHFRAKVLLNFVRANEASEDDEYGIFFVEW